MAMANEKPMSKININQASREELAQVPGSSEHCADAVIRYREEHGGIKSIDEIDQIPGFGEAAVSHFREHCTV